MNHVHMHEIKLMRLTMLAVVTFMLVAACMGTSWAEEAKGVEISSQTLAEMKQDETSTAKLMAPHPENIQIGISPLFGTLQSLDGNRLLHNRFTMGVAGDIRLFPTTLPNLLLEGIFRYAEYDVRSNLRFFDPALIRATAGYVSPATTLRASRQGIGTLGDMRQFMFGGNLKYELFPEAIMTPYIGGGLTYFNNEYYTGPEYNYIKIVLPQSVYAANALAGLKLRLSKYLALLCRGEVGSLLNNRNGDVYYYGLRAGNASLYPFHNFRSYDNYFSGLVGMSFGL